MRSFRFVLLFCPLALLLQVGIAAADYPVTLVSTWGSSGTGDGQFSRPQDVAVASDGSVYVFEDGNSRIQRFTAGGAFMLKWGRFGTAIGTFRGARGIAVAPDGSVFAVDPFHVQRFDASGTWLGQFGSASASNPFYDVWAGPDGHAYVVIEGNFHGVEDYLVDGTFVTTLGTSLNWDPLSVSGDGLGHLFACGSQLVVEMTTSGSVVRTFGSQGPGAGQYSAARAVALDPQCNLLVLDGNGQRVVVYDPNGNFLGQFGVRGTGIAVAPDGTIYVADTLGDRVYVFTQVATPAARTSWGRVKADYR